MLTANVLLVLGSIASSKSRPNKPYYHYHGTMHVTMNRMAGIEFEETKLSNIKKAAKVLKAMKRVHCIKIDRI